VPLAEAYYLRIAADLIERTPWEVVYHRVTGTASPDILLAPAWCAKKWDILNGIAHELEQRNSRQGARACRA
jgi:radical SAM superfamily enzyme